MRWLSAVLLLWATAAPAGHAQVTVIRAERAFTGEGIVENVCIVIDGGRITDVVSTDDYVPIPGSNVIETAGATVAPGFIDSHVHILSPPLGYLSDIDRYGWGRVAEEMSSQVPRNRREFLESGITTTIDMGAPVDSVFRMARELGTGKILGPDVYYSGPLFTAPGGHPAGTTYRGRHALIDTATVQTGEYGPSVRKIDELGLKGVSFIKLVYDDGAFYGRKVPRLDLDLARQVAAAARARGLRVIAHVGAVESGFSDMLGIGVDGIEHCFAFDSSDAVLQAMARRGTFFTPTLSIYEQWASAAMPRMQETVRRAFACGVPIAAGTDFPSTRFLNASEGYFRELELLEQAGIPRIDVLKAATLQAARKLGKDGEVGRLAPGQAANIVVMDGDIREGPLTRDRVRLVLLHGNVVFRDGRLADGLEKGFARSSFVVSPYGFYDPVAGFSVAINALFFNLLNSGVAVGTTAACSFGGNIGAELSVSPPSPVPRTGLKAAIHFDNYPRRCFGTSNETTLSDAVVLRTTNFTASAASATKVAKSFEVDGQLVFDYRAAAAMAGLPAPAVTGGSGGITTIVSAQLARDTRDTPGAPWFGDYEAVSLGLSHPALGSSFEFATLGVDLRFFLPVFHAHVLAGRILYRHSFGDAPFYYRPDFGGSTIGRGFQPGRFVGNIALTGQLEYRFPIWSIVGAVFFVDAGQVQDDFPAFNAAGFHASGGAGARFEFSDSSILSFDLGFTGEPLDREGFSLAMRYSHAF